MDNALVAIMADYPGLLPASQVLMTEVLTPLFYPRAFLTTVYNSVLQEVPSRREAEPAAVDQQGSLLPCRRKRGAVRIKTSPQRRKSARQTVPGEVATQASASQAPPPGPEGEASARCEPDTPPTEHADRLSATRSEVESAMNHRHRRTVFLDACLSPEALNAFNTGDAHLRAAQDGLTRATEQYVKDIRVSDYNSGICQ
ncbi:uncharacterized protein [Triticum aestivum]|uniref:uncharacterized protein n=1 Tax=Triticum aestivum TaxID=4565 RepID=UPI001D0304F7|nr:uncharacterized protein LOC123114716 [Triticum aestivum]